MEMPDKFKINEDKTISLFVDSEEFKFQKNEYLISDSGLVLLKHQTVCMLAGMTNVKVQMPILLSNCNPLIYVFARKAVRGEETFSAIGESNKANLFSDVMMKNPATTADNRAYERAVLGILGLYGAVYGASEISFNDNPKEVPIYQNEETTVTEETTESEPETDNSMVTKTSEETSEPFWWHDTGKGIFTDTMLNPETLIVTEGPYAGKNWTVKQLYEYQYRSCYYFAERTDLESATDNFKKQVYSCRRAIREYGLK